MRAANSQGIGFTCRSTGEMDEQQQTANKSETTQARIISFSEFNIIIEKCWLESKSGVKRHKQKRTHGLHSQDWPFFNIKINILKT